MNTRGVALATLGGAIIWVGLTGVHARQTRNGLDNCHIAQRANPVELERLNVLSGMKPGSGFSDDDYCGASCNPHSYGWDICVDTCLVCIGK
jgi:hypothetical protein